MTYYYQHLPIFLVIVNRHQIPVKSEDIVYIEADKAYLKVFTRYSEHPYVIRGCMKTLEMQLPVTHFCRIHRSFIVNISYIQKIGKDVVNMGKREITLSREYKRNLQARLNPLGVVVKMDPPGTTPSRDIG